MAAKLRIDPLEFRLKNLTDQRMMKVLKAAAEKFGWGTSPAPSGRGFGVACATDVGAYVATLAEVEVNQESGRVRVKRIVCAQDIGLAINPEGARIQMEGSLMMGLGYTLTEEVRFNGGKILDRNFDTYEIPRFSWLPKIETVLIENSGFPPAGGGEPPIVCMGGVIANAIFDATGARLFELPMTPERVKNALAEIKEKKGQQIGS
jgi:CO/xanthine dehydrogenase Mo-binding subunit